MDDYKSFLGMLGGVVALCAFVPYIWAIIRKTTTPNRATWLIWMIVGFLIAGSYYANGARETLWVALSYALGPLVVFVFSLFYGVGGTSFFDRMCLLVAGISLLVWIVFDNPFIALFLNIAIDFAGSLPTFRKVWHEPLSEDRVAWFMFWSAAILNFFAVTRWTWGIALYPMYTLIGSTTMIAFLLFLPRMRRFSGVYS